MRRILISEKGEFKESKGKPASLSVAFRLVVDFYSTVDRKKDRENIKVIVSSNVSPNK